MKRYILQLLPLTFLIFQACKPNTTEENVFDPQATGYQADFRKIVQKGVEVEASLKEDLQKGELILMMRITNNSGKSIFVDYPNCGLSVNPERVVVAETTKAFKMEIPDGEEENYQIYYHPINTLDFYYKTNYRGDMKQRYTLRLDFIRDKSQREIFNSEGFTFKLSENSYQYYLTNYAREKYMQIFAFVSDPDFSETQKRYLEKILAESRRSEMNQDEQPGNEDEFIFAQDPAVTMNKRLIKINAYQFKDTLVVDMRMLNQDAQRLKVSLPHCKIEVKNGTYAPVSHFSDSFPNGQLPDSTYIFDPGTRLHLLLKYRVDEPLKAWSLNTDWLLVDATNRGASDDRWKKLLYTDLSFTTTQIGVEGF